MNLVRQAALIAAHAHRNISYGKGSYFDNHIMVVAENTHKICSQWEDIDKEAAEALAFLHDAYEDRLVSIKAIKQDLSCVASTIRADWIAQMVKEIARYDNQESYEDYIKRLCSIQPPILKRTILAVKAADLLANLGANPADSLKKRYYKALGKIAIHLPEERKTLNDLLLKTQL